MIEFFAVPPGEDAAFLAAWGAEAQPGATVYRALRADEPLRFASLERGPADGVLLLVRFDVPAGEEPRFLAAWEAVRDVFSARQGFLAAEVLPGPVALVHWSSPLMYARAVRHHGDLIAALPYRGHAALYALVR